jgi:hypothetical protein
MEKEHIDLYRKIYNKYCLGHINNTLENRLSIIDEIDVFINQLNNNQSIELVIEHTDQKNHIVYLSNRLVHFFINNDYIIDNIIFHHKLYNRILAIVDHYRFTSIKNIDSEIYNDLTNIYNMNYIKKKVYINDFIGKYTTKHIAIRINI